MNLSLSVSITVRKLTDAYLFAEKNSNSNKKDKNIKIKWLWHLQSFSICFWIKSILNDREKRIGIDAYHHPKRILFYWKKTLRSSSLFVFLLFRSHVMWTKLADMRINWKEENISINDCLSFRWTDKNQRIDTMHWRETCLQQ